LVAKSHSKDLRKGRYSENNRIYLLTTVTYQRQKVFADIVLGRIVIQAMRQQEQEGKVNSLAFVVMHLLYEFRPDHFHWLISLQNGWSLAEVMRSVKGVSSYKIQKIRRELSEIKERQALWQNGFHDHALRKEEDLQKLARYLVANPLRAGLVKKIGDYPLWDAIWLS